MNPIRHFVDPSSGGILAGAGPVIARSLRIEDIGAPPHHHHETSCTRVCARPNECDFAKLLRDLVQIVQRNWNGQPCASKEIWRLRVVEKISLNNSSIEKQLEKA